MHARTLQEQTDSSTRGNHRSVRSAVARSTELAYQRPGLERILVADDDERAIASVADAVQSRYGPPSVCRNSRQLISALDTGLFEAVVLEPNLEGGVWYCLLDRVRRSLPHAKLVVLTAYPSRALLDLSSGVEVHGFLLKPTPAAKVVSTLDAAGPTFESLPKPGRRIVSVEWELINSVIAETQGNMTEAARILGVPRQTLYRKLRKHPQF